MTKGIKKLNKRGITLIELIVAMALTVIVVGASLSFVTPLYNYYYSSVAEAKALRIGSKVEEQLKAVLPPAIEAYVSTEQTIATSDPNYYYLFTDQYTNQLTFMQSASNLTDTHLKATSATRTYNSTTKNGWQGVGVANDNPRIYLNSSAITVTASTKYTFSCLYYTSSTLDDVYLKFNQTGYPESSYYMQPFTAHGTNPSNVSLGDGWYRRKGSFTTLGSTTSIDSVFIDSDVAGQTVFICDLNIYQSSVDLSDSMLSNAEYEGFSMNMSISARYKYGSTKYTILVFTIVLTKNDVTITREVSINLFNMDNESSRKILILGTANNPNESTQYKSLKFKILG